MAVRFLWMTPMPPSCAIAIARRASVTVSMAAETTGRFRTMFRLRWVLRLVSRGNTWEYAGTNNTSSKVSALPRRRMWKAPDAKADYKDRREVGCAGLHTTLDRLRPAGAFPVNRHATIPVARGR